MSNIKKGKITPMVSPSMGLDTNKIRAREDVIKKLGFSFGDLVLLDGYNGMIVLELAPVFTEDLNSSDDRMFVSSVIFSRIRNCDARIKSYSFLLGCDPEFFVLWNSGPKKEIIDAHSILRDYSDSTLGEIRPKPAATVDGLINNIETELIAAYECVQRLPPVEFHGKSYISGTCAGFHLHFNMPQELLCFVSKHSEECIKSIVSVLDSSVGLISRIDPDSGARANSRLNNYGQLGDFKLSMNTLEYRVPGSYWLRSKETSKLLLNYSYDTFQKVLTELKTLSNGWKYAVREDKLRETFNIPSQKETEEIYKTGVRKEIVLKLLKTVPILGNNSCITKNWELS